VSSSPRTVYFLFFLATTLGLTGCGYALVGQASNLPEHIQSIYLESLVNETRRPQVDQIVTRAIAEELVTRKRFHLAESEADADAILRGAITQFSVRPISFDIDGAATEYQTTINARMEFRDLTTDEVLWSNDQYTYRDNYLVDPSAETFFDRERIALERTAIEFARTMVIDLLEGF